MTVTYYFDESVNQAICTGLRLRGIKVLTAQEDGKEATDDREILARATELNYPLVTADRDFLAIANSRLQQAESFSGVILLLSQKAVGYAVRNLEIYARIGDSEDFRNDILFI